MIIKNGNIRGVKTIGGRIDGSTPVPATEILGSILGCNITISADRKGKATDTAQSNFSATILVDAGDVSAWDYDEVIVMDNRSHSYGRHIVQSVEFLEFVNAYKIIV